MLRIKDPPVVPEMVQAGAEARKRGRRDDPDRGQCILLFIIILRPRQRWPLEWIGGVSDSVVAINNLRSKPKQKDSAKARHTRGVRQPFFHKEIRVCVAHLLLVQT